MDSPCCGNPDNAAMARELAAEIDVFQPAVERQPFVETALCGACGGQAHGHVTAVPVEDLLQFGGRSDERVRGQASPRLIEGDPWAHDAVGNQAAGYHDDVRLAFEY